MADWLDRHEFRLTPLSPIHIGTGDDLDWTRCVLDKKNNQVIAFDSHQLRLGNEAQKTLAKLGERALGVTHVSQFMREAQQFFKQQIVAAQQAQIASYAIMPKLIERLDQLTGTIGTRNDRDVAQEMNIARAAYDPRRGLPFVPGSGIKGALRTGWVYKNGGEPNGKFAKDPFSQIAVEDFMPQKSMRTAIVLAQNMKRNASKPVATKGIPLRVEVILPGSDVAFDGAIRSMKRNREIYHFNHLELLAIVHSFHLHHWEEQLPEMEKRADKWWIQAMTALVKNLNGKAVLVRLGKFCTAESKTRADREISVKVSKSRYEIQSHGTTFWLASDEGENKGIPFGWALLEPRGEKSIAADLLEDFLAYEPWKNLKLPAPLIVRREPEPIHLAIMPEVALSLGEAMVRDLQAKFKSGQLNSEYLKSSATRATGFPDGGERRKVGEWLEEHYSKVEKRTFKHEPFKALLRKLQ